MVILASSPALSADFSLPTILGRHLFVDAGPADQFVIRSFAYSPTPICQEANPAPFDTYTDPRLVERDGPWIRSAGANAIRIYGALVTDVDGNGTIGTTLAYIRSAAAQGLWVIMGTEIPEGTDFSNEDVCTRLIQEHVRLVSYFKGEPNILMWAPGNEVDGHTSQPEQWFALLERIAEAIKNEQRTQPGPGSGPAVGPYVCGIIGDWSNDGVPGFSGLDDLAPNIDIWAVNLYRGPSLKGLFEETRNSTQKPLWIAEMGIDSLDNDTGTEDQISQANYIKALWAQIDKHCDVVSGADIAFYSDEWWKAPSKSPCTHDSDGGEFGCGPDNFLNEEWFGVMSISSGTGPINEVVPKKSYQAVKQVWSDTSPRPCDSQAPFLADFNAPDCNDQFSNNYAGNVLPRNDPCTWENILGKASGTSGCPGDWALHRTGSLTPEACGTIAVIMVTLFPEEFPGLADIGSDLSRFDRLAFHVKLGSEDVCAAWDVRLEDGDGAEEWNNQRVSLPPLTTSYQQVRIDISQFITGGGQVVDLARVTQLVFQAISPEPLPPEGCKVDLLLDNLAIFSEENDADSDWVPDPFDNCPIAPNPEQEDSDCDGSGDECDEDDDNDGVLDADDHCPNTIPGVTVDSMGCPALIRGDFDRDGDVDRNDFTAFESCASGPGVPCASGCENQDFDSDNDVDQADFAIFQRCYSGENVPADPNCAS